MQHRWEAVKDGLTYYVDFQGREVVVGQHAGCGHSDNASVISLGEFLVGCHQKQVANTLGDQLLAQILDVAQAKASRTISAAELAKSAALVKKENPTQVCALLQTYAQMEPADDLYAFACGRLAHSKFQSVQVRAAQALSAWKEHRGVEPLRQWLNRLSTGSKRYPLRRQACMALENCVTTGDTVWLIERFLSLPMYDSDNEDRVQWYESLRVILNRFPTEYAATRLAEECRQEDAARSRSALLVFSFVRFPDVLALLEELCVTFPQHPNLSLIEWLIERNTSRL